MRWWVATIFLIIGMDPLFVIAHLALCALIFDPPLSDTMED